MLFATLFFPQLVKRLYSVYGTHKFITVFTTARHISLLYSQINVSPITPFCFPTIYFNITFPPELQNSKYSHLFFLTKNLYPFLSCPMHATRPAHLIVFYLNALKTRGESLKSRSPSSWWSKYRYVSLNDGGPF